MSHWPYGLRQISVNKTSLVTASLSFCLNGNMERICPLCLSVFNIITQPTPSVYFVLETDIFPATRIDSFRRRPPSL